MTKLNNSGTISQLCIISSSRIYNCDNYTLVSTSYVCNACNSTDYTLVTVNTTSKLCVRNDFIIVNCTAYSLNTINNQYWCSTCVSGYTAIALYTVSGQIKVCVQTSSQVIQNCAVYEEITGGVSV